MTFKKFTLSATIFLASHLFMPTLQAEERRIVKEGLAFPADVEIAVSFATADKSKEPGAIIRVIDRSTRSNRKTSEFVSISGLHMEGNQVIYGLRSGEFVTCAVIEKFLRSITATGDCEFRIQTVISADGNASYRSGNVVLVVDRNKTWAKDEIEDHLNDILENNVDFHSETVIEGRPNANLLEVIALHLRDWKLPCVLDVVQFEPQRNGLGYTRPAATQLRTLPDVNLNPVTVYSILIPGNLYQLDFESVESAAADPSVQTYLRVLRSVVRRDEARVRSETQFAGQIR